MTAPTHLTALPGAADAAVAFLAAVLPEWREDEVYRGAVFSLLLEQAMPNHERAKVSADRVIRLSHPRPGAS